MKILIAKLMLLSSIKGGPLSGSLDWVRFFGENKEKCCIGNSDNIWYMPIWTKIDSSG